jgi:molybdate transport system substrate-binding protein
MNRIARAIPHCVPIFAWIAAIVAMPNSPAHAETVQILAAGAVQGAIKRIEPAFLAASGHRLHALFDTVGALRDRVLAGHGADVVILSAAGMQALGKAGRIDPQTVVDLGTISVALAVRKGAAAPDVSSSPEALKRTLLAAASIAYADPARGATAGAHFAHVIERLGIADAIKARVRVLGFGGDVIEGVARGELAIGISQSSEIAAHPGVTLAGHLPAPFAHQTRYLAAQLNDAPAKAEAFLLFLRGPQGRAALTAMGFAPPP